ncbi:MAG TPA: hypothetical protein VIY27_05185 [Myxococcota bacterium]
MVFEVDEALEGWGGRGEIESIFAHAETVVDVTLLEEAVDAETVGAASEIGNVEAAEQPPDFLAGDDAAREDLAAVGGRAEERIVARTVVVDFGKAAEAEGPPRRPSRWPEYR